MKKIYCKKLYWYVISLLLIVGIIVYTCSYISYETPQNIEKIYNGVKFSIKDSSINEKTNIKIVGQYTKTHYGYNSFKGTISFGNVVIKYDDNLSSEKGKSVNIIPINMDVKYNYTTNTNLMLSIYLDKNLNSISIQFYDNSKSNGLYISAPSNTREDGINVLDTFLGIKPTK